MFFSLDALNSITAVRTQVIVPIGWMTLVVVICAVVGGPCTNMPKCARNGLTL